MASDCSVNSPSSSSPCCTVLDAYRSAVYVLILDYYAGASGLPVCLENNAANTVNAAQNQADIDVLTALFDADNCWGGDIAQAPGTDVRSLKSRQDFALRLQALTCEAHFRVDGGWSGQLFFTAHCYLIAVFLLVVCSSVFSHRCFLIGVFFNRLELVVSVQRQQHSLPTMQQTVACHGRCELHRLKHGTEAMRSIKFCDAFKRKVKYSDGTDTPRRIVCRDK